MPSSVAARLGPKVACALAGANVWHEPQPLATQTASPSRTAAAALLLIGRRPGHGQQPQAA